MPVSVGNVETRFVLDTGSGLTLIEISVEVDMGSGPLILDQRFAAELGVDLDASDVRRVDGTETGGAFTQWCATLPGTGHPVGAPALAQETPPVTFQRIVHDGLIGHSFLRRQAVTYDLENRRLIFGHTS